MYLKTIVLFIVYITYTKKISIIKDIFDVVGKCSDLNNNTCILNLINSVAIVGKCRMFTLRAAVTNALSTSLG